jgi:hypothetical protein
MGSLLLILGFILCIGGGFWLLYVASQESLFWALGCLLIPFVSLVFTIMHWSEAKGPFITHAVGFAMIVIGTLLNGPSPRPAG